MWKLPEGMEQWKKDLEEWLNRGIEFINQIPPTQLYIACAVLPLTTALLLLRESHSHYALLFFVIASVFQNYASADL